MYWDALTATGVFVSIVLAAGAFYLALRERPVVRSREAWELGTGTAHDWLGAG